MIALARHANSPRARTVAFMSLTCAQLVYSFSARSRMSVAWLGNRCLRDNRWMMRSVVLSLAAQCGTVPFPPLRRFLGTTPIDGFDARLTAAASTAPTVAREALKPKR